MVTHVFDVSCVKNVLNVVTGSIGAGNYTYYMLKYEVSLMNNKTLNLLYY